MLPIESVLPDLLASLRARPNAVLVAAPGAGKTTRTPLALLNEPWALGRKLILLSPRRITTRAAAAQLARQLGEQVGETVGFRVRLESRVSARTRLEVVTEGVFTRMIQADASLEGVAGVIFDEFHERHLEADLGLALALDAQSGLRPDLRILVMSATLDAEGVSRILGDAAVVVSEGRLHPIDTRHIGRDATQSIEDAMTAAILRALREAPGDVLAFLPGAREIDRVVERLNAQVRDPSIDILPLYGAMDARAQDTAIAPAPPGRRKIVVSTAIAETSLTIEGVRIVVDAGLSRKPTFEPSTGFTRLETQRASQAAVTQRAGRAGRTAPGVCYRLWDAGQTRAFIPFDPPEIIDSDLSGLALDLAEWGAAPEALRWLDPPPAAGWSAATTLLRSVDALDSDGRLTAHGKRIAALPLPARLAHMLLAAADEDLAATAAAVAVTLTEQGLGGRDIDIAARIEAWRRETSPRARAARDLMQRLCRMVGASGEADHDRVGEALALAFPHRIARRRGGGGDALMASGRAVWFEPTSPLARCEWTLVAEASGEAQRARVLAAAALSESFMAAWISERGEHHTQTQFDPQARAIRARRSLRLGAIVVSQTPESKPDKDALRAAWASASAEHGLAMFGDVSALRSAIARVALMRRFEPDRWPEWDEPHLAATLADWGPHRLDTAATADDISGAALADALLDTLDYADRRRLDSEAPVHYVTALGTTIPIDYLSEGAPAVDVRLQEMFGQSKHPAIASGRAPLLLRLLSPAHRPVQTTRDLPGFWAGSYAQVRTEMRGRYPKHPWPDDPQSAEPTRRARPKT